MEKTKALKKENLKSFRKVGGNVISISISISISLRSFSAHVLLKYINITCFYVYKLSFVMLFEVNSDKVLQLTE